jgi:hypothetical protein
MSRTKDHWSVTVKRNGECVLTIESNCLSGRELSADDVDCIEHAARNLLAFIGRDSSNRVPCEYGCGCERDAVWEAWFRGGGMVRKLNVCEEHVELSIGRQSQIGEQDT